VCVLHHVPRGRSALLVAAALLGHALREFTIARLFRLPTGAVALVVRGAALGDAMRLPRTLTHCVVVPFHLRVLIGHPAEGSHRISILIEQGVLGLDFGLTGCRA
jgi:hypothetical protein